MGMLQSLLLHPSNSIRDAMLAINANTKGIVLVVDEAQKLIGTVTDGDIRRAILNNVSINDSIVEVLSGKHGERYPQPVSAPVGTVKAKLLALMQKHSIEQIPLLDTAGCVTDLVTLRELVPDQSLGLNAVVMAGGFGKRLRPLTEHTPKPMLPVGDRPLLEHIVEQLRDSGIKNISMSLHFEAEQITDHFQDGAAHGVNISYLREDSPLGTAGGLCLLDRPQQPLLVMNGDILTKVDFRALLAYHREHQAAVTVSVRKYDLAVPFGVVESDGKDVIAIREKPTVQLFVNAGIYLLEPYVLDFIPHGLPFDMPDLINKIAEAKQSVCAFPIWEQWLDIGEPKDYFKATNSSLEAA